MATAIAISSCSGQRSLLSPEMPQSGNFALVEVVVNNVHEGYLTTNNLTTAQGIETYVQQRAIRFPVRSMEVKAAWRLFRDTD